VVRVGGDALPETCFTVMAGLGFDAAIMAGASDALKARMGWRAYVVSAVRNLRYPASRVEVSVDHGPYQRFRARTVVVATWVCCRPASRCCPTPASTTAGWTWW